MVAVDIWETFYIFSRSLIDQHDDEMRKEFLWNQSMAEELPEAIRQRQIRPYLQAIVDSDGEPVGAEALVRWLHPTEGFLAPY